MKKGLILPLGTASILLLCAGYASAAKTVINYVTWWVGEMAETEKLAVKTFMDRNPNIEVRMSTWNWEGYHDKFLASTIAGLAPDVFKADVYYVRDYIDSGIALDIEPYIKRDKYDLSGWYQFTLDPVRNPRNGKLHGFPSNWGGIMFFANRDFFSSNGLALPNDGWTWSEFGQYMGKMRKDTNGDGKPDRHGAGLSYWNWWAWAYTNNASLFSKDERKVTLDTPEVSGAFKFLNDMLVTTRYAIMDNADSWGSGRHGMTMSWTHTVQSIRPKFPVTILEFPYNKSRSFTIKGDCMAIHSGSKKKEAAWKFMKWYMSEDFQKLQMKYGLAPIQRKLAETEWVKWTRPGFDIDVKNALPNETGRKARYLECGTPTWRKMEQLWNVELNTFYSGKGDPDRFGAKLQPSLQKILDEYWKRIDKRKK